MLLLAAAAALRVLAALAISPGIWFSDSNSYIRAAATGELPTARVAAYGLFVAPFWHLGSALALITFQHVLGLGMVVVLYTLLLRRGVGRWLALAAVVPAALDAYLVVLEHTVMAETTYHAAVLGGIALLLWQDEPGWAAALGAGLLLGYASVARSVGIPLAAVVLVYLLVRRLGVRRIAAFAAGWALVAGAYVVVFHAQHGEYAFTTSGGRFLYARVAPFADCDKVGMPARLRRLCPDAGPELRTNSYLWGPRSPIADLPPDDPRPGEFARRIIRGQPLDYTRVVVRGTLHYFEPGHRIANHDYPVAAWQFPADPRRWSYPGYRGPIRPAAPLRGRDAVGVEPNRHVAHFAGEPSLDVGASKALHHYQRVAYTWGPLLAACLLLVAVALVARRGTWRLRADAALLAALTLVALAVPQALSQFSYRYGLIAALLLPPAAALAATALRTGGPAQPPDASNSAAADRPVRTAPSM